MHRPITTNISLISEHDWKKYHYTEYNTFNWNLFKKLQNFNPLQMKHILTSFKNCFLVHFKILLTSNKSLQNSEIWHDINKTQQWGVINTCLSYSTSYIFIYAVKYFLRLLALQTSISPESYSTMSFCLMSWTYYNCDFTLEAEKRNLLQ